MLNSSQDLVKIALSVCVHGSAVENFLFAIERSMCITRAAGVYAEIGATERLFIVSCHLVP